MTAITDQFPEGNAIVFCEGAFLSTNGKTAHGLVRRTDRYRIICVIDSTCCNQDARELLDGRRTGIPIVAKLEDALAVGQEHNLPASHFVIGIAPDGGRLDPAHRSVVADALKAGLHVDCGLHDYLCEDPTLAEAARNSDTRIRDIRRPPHTRDLHFFSGKIEQVDSTVIAVLGTDSALGKRTTAWLMVEAMRKAGKTAEMVGTGQTAWLQGARWGLILDSMINDFLAGEIEHAVHSCWQDSHPEFIFLEGQGSLMNPAYPGGFELLAAGRPDGVIMQHAPTRIDYDGFPGYPIQPLTEQIQAVELISGRPVIAVTVNHENLDEEKTRETCQQISADCGLPTVDPLRNDVTPIIEKLLALRKELQG